MKKLMFLALMIAPLSLFSQKFGHLDSGIVIQLMPEYTQAQADLQTLQKQFEDELQYMRDEFTRKSEEFAEQSSTLPENIRQRRDQELEELYNKMNLYYQDSQQTLQMASQEKMGEITTKILKAIRQVGDEGGFIYIFDSAGDMVPYVSQTLSTDVTELVKAKLGIK
ncbi:MAG TPA: OmpH family outer membrane protein [Bacteroidaceae bacterium]|nr:OmpH family outer membrane protein [Bacteroidaceae bacterium]